MSETHVLLVCTGNTCRSAMAEGLFNRMLVEGKIRDVVVRSAGTIAGGGSPASEGAVRACEEVQVDISKHGNTPLTKEIVDWADVVLCMEHYHAHAVSTLSPPASSKTHLLGEWGPTDDELEVFDPVGLPTSAYRQCRDRLFDLLRKFLDDLPRFSKRHRTIAVGCDRSGLELKDALCAHLESKEWDVLDCGPFGEDATDDPSAAVDVGRRVSGGLVELGVLIGATGVGMSIAANKIPGVRAALCADPEYAEECRGLHDANVLCVGARFIDVSFAKLIVDAWLGSEYQGGEDDPRLSVIDRLELEFSRR